MLRKFTETNRKLSKKFDLLFPEKFRIAGGRDFVRNVVPRYLTEGTLIYDVGGGKQPVLSVADKNRLKTRVIGIDICREELDSAPKGAYDATKEIAIENVVGIGDGDLVLCRTLLEHLVDTRRALAGIFSLLKPNGLALIFVPCRNAIFARLNIVIPQSLKRKILYSFYPNTARTRGFPTYYDNCTPKLLSGIFLDIGFQVIEERYYYWSSYFSLFFPLYIFWRILSLIFYALFGQEAAEGLAFVLKKPAMSRK